MIILLIFFMNTAYGLRDRGITGCEYMTDNKEALFVPLTGYPLKICTMRGVPEKFKKGIREAIIMWNMVYNQRRNHPGGNPHAIFEPTPNLEHTFNCYVHIFPKEGVSRLIKASAQNAGIVDFIFFEVLWPALDCIIGYNKEFWEKNNQEMLFFTNVIAHELGHCLGISHYTNKSHHLMYPYSGGHSKYGGWKTHYFHPVDAIYEFFRLQSKE